MALKFLNKKGWHTGSLRNIENVWKAEQKHEAEQKKLEELRKQILEERERSEFRLLQEQAGLVPKQERLDFLYDSGLAVGKGSSSDGFKALEAFPKTDSQTASSSSSSAKQQQQQQPSVPGALFEEKPQSANDAWRKLHSDPLLLIRQREQEALARVKNNPIQMAMIRKSVEAKKYKEKKTSESKKSKERHHHRKSKHQKRSSSQCHFVSENIAGEGEERSTDKSLKYNEPSDKLPQSSVRELKESNSQRKMNIDKVMMYSEQPSHALLDSTMDNDETQDGSKKNLDKAKHEKYYLEGQMDSISDRKGREGRRTSIHISSDMSPRRESHQKRQSIPFKLSKEEMADKLQKMQMDAELHEEQRWKRLKKADEIDAQEALSVHTSRGRNFLDAAQKSVYGSERGGSATIEESVRRRTHYLQSRSTVDEGNAFRR